MSWVVRKIKDEVIEPVLDLGQDIVDFAVDEIIDPVVTAVGDTVEYALDNPIEAAVLIASIIAPGPWTAWAIPLASGAQTLVDGGSLGDAVKAAAISAISADIGAKVGTYVGPSIETGVSSAITNEKLASTVSSALTKGTEQAAKTYVATGDLNSAGNAFLTTVAISGVQDGVKKATDKVMGNIEQSLQDSGLNQSLNDLSIGVQDSIIAGVAAELTGQNVSSAMLNASAGDILSAIGDEDFINRYVSDTGFIRGVVDKYTSVVSYMDGLVNNFKDSANKNLTDTQIKLITDATTAAWDKAKIGNPELSGEAFFESLGQDAYDNLYDIITDPVNAALDKITGNYDKTTTAAEAIETESLTNKGLVDAINADIDTVNELFTTQETLQATYLQYRAVVEAGGATQNQVDAYLAAEDAFKKHVEKINAEYPALKKTIDDNMALRSESDTKLTTLTEKYEDAFQYIVSDAEDLDAALTPVQQKTDKIAAIVTRPGLANIDEAEYRKLNNLDADADIYDHYLRNSVEVDKIVAADMGAQIQTIMDSSPAPGESELDWPTQSKLLKNQFESYDTLRTIAARRTPLKPLQSAGDYSPNVDTEAPTQPIRPERRPDTIGVEYNNLTDEQKASLVYTGSSKNPELTLIKTLAGQAAVGTFENLGQMVYGAGRISQVATDEIIDYFDAENQFGHYAQPSVFNQYLNNPSLYVASKLTSFLQPKTLSPAEEVEEAAGIVRRRNAFTNTNNVVNDGAIFVGDLLTNLGTLIEDKIFTEEEQAILAKSNLVGTKPNELQFVSEDGTALGFAGNVSNEVGGEILDFLLKGNPFAVGVSSTLNAGEAVEGAASQAEQTVEDLFNANTLQDTDIYKETFRDYEGDVEKTKNFITAEILRNSIVKVASVGLIDVIMPGVGKNIVGNAAVQGLGEGSQEVAESAILLNSVNNVLGTDLPIFKDASGNFVMGATVGATVTTIAEGTHSIAGAVKGGDDDVKPVEPESGGATPARNDFSAGIVELYGDPSDVADAVARYEAYGVIESGLTAWGVSPIDSTPSEYISTLGSIGITDRAVAAGIAKVNYGSAVSTKEEVETVLKATYPSIEFSTQLTNDVLDNYVGATSTADLDNLINTFIAPMIVDRQEIQAAAAEEGVVLTDDEADEYVTEGDEDTVTDKVKTDVDSRAVTEAEVRAGFAALDYTPDDDEVQQFTGQKNEDDLDELLFGYVDPRQITDAEARAGFAALDYTPDDDEVRQFTGQKDEDALDELLFGYVDPRQVTSAEARKYFTDLGYDPTDEQVANFVAQVAETEQSDIISKYVDPRQVTRSELETIANEEGLTLTDALAATYVGQGEAATFSADTLAAARTEYDPLATTVEEATQFFADTGYTATPEEIADFVTSKAEAVQQSAIGEYVNPRQVTEDEAAKFLSDIGYNATSDEVASFVGQANDDTYQSTQRTAVSDYVDPRYVDEDEVRAAFSELGLAGVSQADVDKFVGQFDETTQLAAVSDYLPTAQYNSLVEMISNATATADTTQIQALIDDAISGLNNVSNQDVTDAITEALSTRNDLSTNDVQNVVDSSIANLNNLSTDDVQDIVDTSITDTETRLTALIDANETAGLTRDQATQSALDTLTQELGTTETELLAEIGTTKAALTGDITQLGEDIADTETRLTALIDANETAGLTRDQATQSALDTLTQELGTTEAALLAEIGTTKAALTADISQVTDAISDINVDLDAIAAFVGKPKRDVTQVDVDYVVDLIAQENITDELLFGYDVDASGDITQADVDLLTNALAGDTTVDLASSSLFGPATGLYATQETDAQTIQDLITQLNTDNTTNTNTALDNVMDTITDQNTQMTTDIEDAAKNQGMRDLLAAEAAGAFRGAGVQATTPDPVNIDYFYDIGGDSIFATEDQASKFISPYGGTRAAPTGSRIGQPLMRKFSQGGQVHDTNDMLLKLLGDM